jgi:hypothetical protein
MLKHTNGSFCCFKVRKNCQILWRLVFPLPIDCKVDKPWVQDEHWLNSRPLAEYCHIANTPTSKSKSNPPLQDALGMNVSKDTECIGRSFVPYIDLLRLNQAWQTITLQKISISRHVYKYILFVMSFWGEELSDTSKASVSIPYWLQSHQSTIAQLILVQTQTSCWTVPYFHHLQSCNTSISAKWGMSKCKQRCKIRWQGFCVSQVYAPFEPSMAIK